MVLRGGEMTTRPKNLHNFTLPNLKWGTQRHLKCSKIDSLSTVSSGDLRLRRRSPPYHHRSSNFHHPLKNGGVEEEEVGIDEFMVKIMSDLKTVRDKITHSMMFRRDVVVEEEQENEKVCPVKPWNLRKRRAACKEPVSEKIVNPSPTRVTERGGVVEAETTRRLKFSVKLSKKEIEEDFMTALGHRPPRRPKKRPRTVQRKLDSLQLGFYLTEVTLDAYKVPEEAKNM